MIYYEDAELVIRDMEKADAQVFYDEYTAQKCCSRRSDFYLQYY